MASSASSSSERFAISYMVSSYVLVKYPKFKDATTDTHLEFQIPIEEYLCSQSIGIQYAVSKTCEGF